MFFSKSIDKELFNLLANSKLRKLILKLRRGDRFYPIGENPKFDKYIKSTYLLSVLLIILGFIIILIPIRMIYSMRVEIFFLEFFSIFPEFQSKYFGMEGIQSGNGYKFALCFMMSFVFFIFNGIFSTAYSIYFWSPASNYQWSRSITRVMLGSFLIVYLVYFFASDGFSPVKFNRLNTYRSGFMTLTVMPLLFLMSLNIFFWTGIILKKLNYRSV